VGTAIGKGCSYRLVGIFRQVTSPTQQLAPALDIDARLTEIERSLNLLLNVTPVNAAEAWADFERSDFAEHRIPAKTAWSIAIRVVVGGFGLCTEPKVGTCSWLRTKAKRTSRR
jgi:hypothetical protein